MNEIIFASANSGKIEEVVRVGKQYGVNILSPLALVSQCGSPPDVEETGANYLENARLKAMAYSQWSGLPCIGDDSGLEVTCLGGAPGLYTARFAGEGASSALNMEKLLSTMEHEADRSARYVSVLSFVNGREELHHAEGYLYGAIAFGPRGEKGFGYDPIFEVEDTGKTLAELKETQEVETHRCRSLKILFEKL